MNPSRIRRAVTFVAEKIRKGENVAAVEAITGDDVEGWLEGVAMAVIRRETAALKSNTRAGSRAGAISVQLALPGMEHAALPPLVWRKDDDGLDVAVPLIHATKAEIRREVELNRRVVTVIDRVVAGWEATLAKLDELGVPDDETGLGIVGRFGSSLDEVEGGGDA